MSWFLSHPLTWLVATLLAYRLGVHLRDRTGHPVAQPVLVGVVLLAAALVLLLVAAALAAGCARTSGPGYYWQSLTGHADLMWRARPVADWLADPATPEALRQRLSR